MVAEPGLTLVRRLFEEGVNQRQLAVIDDLVASDFLLHSAVLGDVRGGEAYKRSVQAFLAPCPDFRASIEDLRAADDCVVARLAYRGTDTGGFFGHPPTGKAFTLTAIYIFRVVDGRLAELWQEADRLGMIQQLGHGPTPMSAAGQRETAGGAA
jgi:steroid delta-isomerase-like uncharacterized protein